MDDKGLIALIITGTSMMFFLGMLIITFVVLYSRKMDKKNNAIKLAVKNQEVELLKAVLETQETEREQIAANLHDEIGPLLTSHKLNLNLLIYDLKDGLLTTEKIKKEQVFIDGVINDIRRVSYDLTPHFLLKFGLDKALRNHLSKISTVDIEIDVNFDSVLLDKATQINTYRIVLELLNNILKHDTPSGLQFTGSIKMDLLEIQVDHNGRGLSNDEFIDLAKHSQGLGLNSIQSRVSVLGAELLFNRSNDNAGFILQIPISNNEK